MKKLCTVCGEVQVPIIAKKGSTGVAIIMWLLWLLPGVIYSIWRANSAHEVCPSCGSPQVIPVDSPVARKMLGPEYYEQEQRELEEFIAQQKASAEESSRREREESARLAGQPFLVRNAGNLAIAGVFVLCICLMTIALWVNVPAAATQTIAAPAAVAESPAVPAQETKAQPRHNGARSLADPEASRRAKANCEANGFVWRDGICHRL
jgi:hypothetical protein